MLHFHGLTTWLPNITPPDSAKVKGAIVDGPFLSGRKSLAAIPMGSKPGPISFTKIWSKVVDKVLQDQQKKIALQEPKLKKLHQYSFVCVSVFLGQKWGMWMKNQLYQSELCSNFELSYNLNSYFSLFLYFVRSVKRVKSLLKQYGMAWNEGTNLEPQIWLYLQQLHSIALKSARVLNP